MEFEINIHSHFYRILLTFLSALWLNFYIVPRLIKLSLKKGLVDQPNSRTVHQGAIPNLGGVALFISILIPILLFLNVDQVTGLQFRIVGIIIIFLLGLKDDILSLSPQKKFYGEIIASLLVIILGGVRITSFYGFMGIHQLDYTSSLVISLFVFLLVTNAFNLIDGIDGLCAGIGIVSAAVLGIWFFYAGYFELTVLSAAVTGGLSSFFYFNVFGRMYKMFMGDSGSLLIGFIVSMLVIRFLGANLSGTGFMELPAAPAVAMGILVVPLFDTLRVFLLRILSRHSPFHPDRRHLHHILLDLGFSHLQATARLIITNISFILLALILQYYGLSILGIVSVMLGTAIGLSLVPTLMLRKKRGKQLRSLKLEN